MAIGNKLEQLLAEGIEFAPRYQPSLNSDHLPMTLCAMAGLGASDSVLQAYRDKYAEILSPLKATSHRVSDWHEAMGNYDEYAEVRNLLITELENHPAKDVIAEYLPALLPSLAFEAFHPLIRLAYAIDANFKGEIANALAYWIVCHEPVPVATNRVCLSDQLQHQVDAGPIAFSDSRFSASLRILIENNSYPQGSSESFEDCARVSLDVYRSTRNFFALHLVTATQAARICSRFVPEQDMLSALTGAILAAHLVVGSPAFSREHPLAAPIRGDHEHMHKYIYACVSEYRHYGDKLYLDEIAAYRDAGLVARWVTV